jgi:hypothetical protein
MVDPDANNPKVSRNGTLWHNRSLRAMRGEFTNASLQKPEKLKRTFFA